MTVRMPMVIGLHQELFGYNLAATNLVNTKFLVIHTATSLHSYIYVHGQRERIGCDQRIRDLKSMLLLYHFVPFLPFRENRGEALGFPGKFGTFHGLNTDRIRRKQFPEGMLELALVAEFFQAKGDLFCCHKISLMVKG